MGVERQHVDEVDSVGLRDVEVHERRSVDLKHGLGTSDDATAEVLQQVYIVAVIG